MRGLVIGTLDAMLWAAVLVAGIINAIASQATGDLFMLLLSAIITGVAAWRLRQQV